MSSARLLRDLVVGPLPSSRTQAPPASLAPWAQQRGLEYRAEGLLPPVTPQLRAGLGAGSHKSVKADPEARGWSTYTSERAVERPERTTTDLCQGMLPGGLAGVLARHTHLRECSDTDGGSYWSAATSTVVFAELGAAARAVCELSVGKPGDVRALASFGRPRESSDPRRTMVAPSRTVEVREGLRWTTTPAEDAATLDVLVAGAAAELAVAPKGVEVELEFGYLCVWVGRELTDAGELDALCRAAAAIADGLGVVADRTPPLLAAVPAGAPARTHRRRWIEDGMATIEWAEPPADVPAAVAAYARVVGGRARRVGWTVGALVCAVAVLVSAAAIWVGLETGMAAGGIITAGFAAVLAFSIVRGSIGLGRDLTADETAARARPWGLAAFVAGYAGARALAVEDADKLRRAFPSPIRGRSLAALHGRIHGRVDGHLVIWFEPGAGVPGRYWLLAITAAPAQLAAPPAPYQAEIRGDLLVTAIHVAADDRSIVALDALAAVAAELTTAQPAAV
jgi:hypothetical protein